MRKRFYQHQVSFRELAKAQLYFRSSTQASQLHENKIKIYPYYPINFFETPYIMLKIVDGTRARALKGKQRHAHASARASSITLICALKLSLSLSLSVLLSRLLQPCWACCLHRSLTSDISGAGLARAFIYICPSPAALVKNSSSKVRCSLSARSLARW